MEDNLDHNVSMAVRRTPLGIVLTDPARDGYPITYVNEAFERITLYRRDDVLGRDCRFLQGEATAREDLEKLEAGLESGEEFQLTITLHKADGTPFRNQMLISPVHDDDGDLAAYFTVQRELGEEFATEDGLRDVDRALDLLRELQHRVKNHLAMVVSMIRLQATRRVTPDSLRAVGRRIEALALLYDEMFETSVDGRAGESVAAGHYLERIASVIAALEGREGIDVNVDCDEVDLPLDRAARLGLLLSEFLTNALEHAFEGRDSGLVNVRFQRLSNGGVRLSVEDDGIGLPEGSNWPFEAMSVERQHARAARTPGPLDTTGTNGRPGVGGSIVAALTQTLAATVDVNTALKGTTVTVDLDAE